jgi:hypothetical protein
VYKRITRRPNHTTIAAYLALFVALGGTTYAATGGNFILGQSNSAGSTTALSSGTTGPALKVTSTNTATGGTALGLNVPIGHAPFTVNSSTKVAKLNADKLDGKDSTNWKMEGVISSSGPLPIEAGFTSSGGKLLIMASGSGYRASSNITGGNIGMDVKVDGNLVGRVKSYTNERDSHKAFVTGFIVDPLIGTGSHTIRLEAAYDSSFCGTANELDTDLCTATDNRDNFQVTVTEIPS